MQCKRIGLSQVKSLLIPTFSLGKQVRLELIHLTLFVIDSLVLCTLCVCRITNHSVEKLFLLHFSQKRPWIFFTWHLHTLPSLILQPLSLVSEYFAKPSCSRGDVVPTWLGEVRDRRWALPLVHLITYWGRWSFLPHHTPARTRLPHTSCCVESQIPSSDLHLPPVSKMPRRNRHAVLSIPRFPALLQGAGDRDYRVLILFCKSAPANIDWILFQITCLKPVLSPLFGLSLLYLPCLF